MQLFVIVVCYCLESIGGTIVKKRLIGDFENGPTTTDMTRLLDLVEAHGFIGFAWKALESWPDENIAKAQEYLRFLAVMELKSVEYLIANMDAGEISVDALPSEGISSSLKTFSATRELKERKKNF